MGTRLGISPTIRNSGISPDCEWVFGRCAPCDPPRSSNKQKEQALFACSPHFERVVAPVVPTLLRSDQKYESKLSHSRSSLRAGDENRTRLYSLGSCRSTDELHPRWHLAAFRV